MWHVTVGRSMLEPLPQGMHDRRVSSAESEARQIGRRSRPEIPSQHNLRHRREFVGEVARRQSMEASVDQHRQLVVDPIGISKPEQFTDEWCHVLGSTGSVDQPRRRVEHGPQSVHQPIRDWTMLVFIRVLVDIIPPNFVQCTQSSKNPSTQLCTSSSIGKFAHLADWHWNVYIHSGHDG